MSHILVSILLSLGSLYLFRIHACMYICMYVWMHAWMCFLVLCDPTYCSCKNKLWKWQINVTVGIPCLLLGIVLFANWAYVCFLAVSNDTLDGYNLQSLEYVHVTITLKHECRGDLEIRLHCPSETESVIGATRTHDKLVQKSFNITLTGQSHVNHKWLVNLMLTSQMTGAISQGSYGSLKSMKVQDFLVVKIMYLNVLIFP